MAREKSNTNTRNKKPQVTAYNDKLRDKATNSGGYVFVGGKPNNIRFITGAEKAWSSEPNVMYVPGMLIAGTEDNIINALTEYGIPKEEIDELLKEAITFENSREGGKMYNLYQDLKKERKSKSRFGVNMDEEFTFEQTLWLANNVGNAKIRGKCGNETKLRGRRVAGRKTKRNADVKSPNETHEPNKKTSKLSVASPTRNSPKKQSPKKQSPKKQSPKKQSPKKQSPKKVPSQASPVTLTAGSKVPPKGRGRGRKPKA